MFIPLVSAFREIVLLISYFHNSSFPQPLQPTEEKSFLERFKKGDEEARQVLIKRNLRLVAHVIKKYDHNQANLDKEDLISIGSIGLIKAINTFNPDKGTRLATYAARCIENEILMVLRSEGKKNWTETSLQDPLGSDKEGNELKWEDILSCEESMFDQVELSLLKEQIKRIKNKLKYREQRVLELRFGLSGNKRYTQKEIAKLLGISRSYVSRIEKKIVQKLEQEFQS